MSVFFWGYSNVYYEGLVREYCNLVCCYNVGFFVFFRDYKVGVYGVE